MVVGVLVDVLTCLSVGPCHFILFIVSLSRQL